MSKGTVSRKARFGVPIFLPCGTKFHAFFLMQVTWREEEHRIWRAIDRRASIAWNVGPPIDQSSTCAIKGVITA